MPLVQHSSGQRSEKLGRQRSKSLQRGDDGERVSVSDTQKFKNVMKSVFEKHENFFASTIHRLKYLDLCHADRHSDKKEGIQNGGKMGSKLHVMNPR